MNINRRLTNIIRFIMDECIPPIIRDNKYFMYPFFWVAYRGNNVEDVMKFKKNVYGFTDEEYKSFYSSLSSISRNRKTDLNSGCLQKIQQLIPNSASSVIDIGCGNGFLLNQLEIWYPHISLHACDVVKTSAERRGSFTVANVTNLPFADKSYDVTLCSHTLEHILDLQTAICQLKRITRQRLIIVVPCQRYYYYTLDEHVNFFQLREQLSYMLSIPVSQCVKIQGDWLAYVDFE